MRKVTFGDALIGQGEPIFVIAEIGYNFNTLEEAKQSIDAAIDCGADAVKFQTFRVETITSRDAMFPPEAGDTSQFEEFKQYEMSEELHYELFGYARERGILCFSTPSYYDDVELLDRVGVPAYKIGSDDLTNLPFLEFIAERERPIVLSTGMANLAEVAEAVSTILDTGNDQLVLLHCLSNYPIRDLTQVNLRAMQTLREAFQLPVGFSDHSTGISVPIAAVALGAVVIEKHFTIDKQLPVPDAFFSADPAEFKAMVDSIRQVERALGSGLKVPASTERDMRKDTRKSIIAAKDIPKGTIITRDMVIIKRPGWGIEPRLLPVILGRAAQVDIGADEVITWDKV